MFQFVRHSVSPLDRLFTCDYHRRINIVSFVKRRHPTSALAQGKSAAKRVAF